MGRASPNIGEAEAAIHGARSRPLTIFD